MSVFGELRLENCLSLLPSSSPSSPLPLPRTVHVLLITPKSRSGPRASTFFTHMVWCSDALSLETPPTRLPPIRPHIRIFVWTRSYAFCGCAHIYTQVWTHTRVLYANKHTHSPTHTFTYTSSPQLPPLGSFWLTVPAPARDYGGRQGVEAVGRGDGLWGRARESEKEGWGLGPLSFINLNVYTSWSLAMRPLSFPQVSPSRICSPFLHRFSAGEEPSTLSKSGMQPSACLIRTMTEDGVVVERHYSVP